MKSTKRLITLLLALCMILALAACAPAAPAPAASPSDSAPAPAEPSESTPATSPSEPAPAEQPVEITWWAFPTFAQDGGAAAGTYEQTIIDAFQTANPNIKVKLQTIDFQSGPDKIAAAIQGNTMPDILFDAPGRIIDYGKQGKLVPLDDMFTDEFVKDVNNPALIEACKGNGVAYMYPISSAPFYMAINKKMWEETGAMEYVNMEGDRTWTTEDFANAIKKLKDGGKLPGTLFCAGQGGDQGTRAFLCNLFGAKIANDDLTAYAYNSPEGIKALETAQEWLKAGTLGNGTAYAGGDDIEQFVSGYTSYEFCWGTSTAKSNAEKMAASGVEAISLPFPSASGTPELEYLVNGFCVFDNGDAARAEAAKTFIKFLCDDPTWGPKNVIQTGAFPVRQSFGDLYPGDAEMALLSSWTKYYGPFTLTMDGWTQQRVEWYTMLQAITTGDKDASTAANDYVNNSNAAMNG